MTTHELDENFRGSSRELEKSLVTPLETSIFTLPLSSPSSSSEGLVRSGMIGSGGSLPILVGLKRCRSLDHKLGLNLVRSRPRDNIELMEAGLLVAICTLVGMLKHAVYTL